MMERQQTLALMERALAACGGEQAEVRLVSSETEVTRYADNRIHQSISRHQLELSVRVILGGASGMATTNQLDAASLAQAAERAESLARSSRPDPGFVSLPGPTGQPTAGCAGQGLSLEGDAELRAAAVARLSSTAGAAGAMAHGYISGAIEQVAVANSLGVRAHHARKRAGAVVLVQGDGRSGYASQAASGLSDLAPDQLAERALSKWELGRDPVEAPPGDYQVVLEPEAFRDLVVTLAMGFDARAAQQGRSFVSGKLDQQVTSELINLHDDGHDPRGLPMPFDAEGVPRQRLTLLEAGVARQLAMDSYTAYSQGAEPTGHTLPADFPLSGALPMNLFLEPGRSSLQELIAATERGLLVTRFWYHRVINPRQTTVTGLTRDGTFLIEGGRLTRAVHNLRYTDSVLRALASTLALGDQLQLLEYGPGSLLLPAVRLGQFRFTGTTRA